jgi:acyl carrier protein
MGNANTVVGSAGATAASADREELLEKVRIAFKSAFDVDPKTITIDTVPSDVSSWDSMGHVTLASSLEQTFGLTFDVDDLMAMENVKEICRIVQSKLNQVS